MFRNTIQTNIFSFPVHRRLLQLPPALVLRVRHGLLPRGPRARALHLRRDHLRPGHRHGLRGAHGEGILHAQVREFKRGTNVIVLRYL